MSLPATGDDYLIDSNLTVGRLLYQHFEAGSGSTMRANCWTIEYLCLYDLSVPSIPHVPRILWSMQNKQNAIQGDSEE